ncbi:epimerase [Undibacterium sp. KW1]|uniref:TIGR01777 family oxidoreductase n=1 Tax=Undibacterium sp. KW1 TaxID=2058624 RepID=UPI001331F8C5|nr:TIGR01777 family oxidoreductase [Undibacterium sp. KW1]BBB59740.1 epimerase [Undibacterium sp. KW1]
MNTHLIALQLMAAQGLLGAFDTLYHHELTEALPQRASARKELGIHATRALIYSLLFIGLSAWAWHGAWAIVLLLVFGVEIVLTLWDFVIEDQTRLLPATERVTHTVLAINGGAFITLLILNTPEWFAANTQMQWQPQGWLSVFLALCGVGVGVSGIRDGLAALHLGKIAIKERQASMIHFSDKSEQVLVTGATGFIGTLLVKALLADGQQVTILSRNPKQASWKFDGKARVIASMEELPANQRVDIIINLAGARILGWRWSEKRKAELRHSRTGLTKEITAWISRAESKPRLLLAASAIGYYGIQAMGDDRELTESAAPQSIFMSELCQEWEQANQAATTYGVKVARMRFGVVLGQQGALGMMLLPIKLGLGGALGSGKQWQSWIHVHDVLRGIAHLWQHEASLPPDSAYNFTAPEVVTQKQFSTIAAHVLHRPCFFPTPGWPMRLMLGEQADLLLEGQRVVPAKLLHDGFVFDYPDLRSAISNLA